MRIANMFGAAAFAALTALAPKAHAMDEISLERHIDRQAGITAAPSQAAQVLGAGLAGLLLASTLVAAASRFLPNASGKMKGIS